MNSLGRRAREVLAWRERGYQPDRVQELLQADPSLITHDADAFTVAGIVGAHQVDWIQHRFSASEAAADDEMDVQPNEARVWR